MRTKEDRERYKRNPIFGTDFSKPVSELIKDVRGELIKARGHLDDIAFGTAWEDRVNHVIGLLTCGIQSLYYSHEEMVKYEQRIK